MADQLLVKVKVAEGKEYSLERTALAWIDSKECVNCGICREYCPVEAISMVRQQEGNWFHSETPYGDLFHAELFPGRENSGKLVTLVKQHARLMAEETQSKIVLVDGPPGIGCPVISACAGADLGLIVTEPGLSGLHDLKRVLSTLQHFRIPSVICINKADLYPDGTLQIEKLAEEQTISIVGKIPFGDEIPKAMLKGKPITAFAPKSLTALAIQDIWENTTRMLFS